MSAIGASPAEEIEELHRRLEWAGPHVSFETILENLQRELGYGRGIR